MNNKPSECSHEEVRPGVIPRCRSCGWEQDLPSGVWRKSVERCTVPIYLTPSAHKRVNRIADDLSYRHGNSRVNAARLLSGIIMDLRTTPELLESLGGGAHDDSFVWVVDR